MEQEASEVKAETDAEAEGGEQEEEDDQEYEVVDDTEGTNKESRGEGVNVNVINGLIWRVVQRG